MGAVLVGHVLTGGARPVLGFMIKTTQNNQLRASYTSMHDDAAIRP